MLMFLCKAPYNISTYLQQQQQQQQQHQKNNYIDIMLPFNL